MRSRLGTELVTGRWHKFDNDRRIACESWVQNRYGSVDNGLKRSEVASQSKASLKPRSYNAETRREE